MVERFAGHRNEHGRDTQCVAVGVFENVGRARDIPAGVSASLECVAQPAVRETRSVGFTLDQGLAGELRQCTAVADRLEEAVVLLGRQPGQWIEDVGVVGCAFLQRPVLHRRRDRIGDHGIKRFALLDRRHHRLVDELGQSLLHDHLVEDVGTEHLAGCLVGGETDHRRCVGLDVLDRLQANCISTHVLTPRPGPGLRC